MWREESDIWAYEDGVAVFCDFLGTTDYQSFLSPQEEPISLIGALYIWLYDGDGLIVCPNYGAFMFTTVLIIENWLAHDRVSVGDCPLWPFEAGIAVPLIETEQSNVQHQPRLLLNRSGYKQLKSTKESMDRDIASGLIAQIAAHLGISQDDSEVPRKAT